MTDRDAFLSALSILIDNAPEGIDITVLAGDQNVGDIIVLHNCSDECSSALIEVAHNVITGVIEPEHKDTVTNNKDTLQ